MWFSGQTLRDRVGEAGAAGVLRAAQDAVDEIGRFCSEQEVDAWYRQSGYLQVSAAPAQDHVLDEAVETCREFGESEQAQGLSADQVAQRCRSPRFRGGVLYPGAATVQPARLALGLRERLSRAAPASGSSRTRRFAGCAPEAGAAWPRRRRPGSEPDRAS